MNNDGTLKHESVNGPDFPSLMRSLDKCEIKSFTVIPMLVAG